MTARGQLSLPGSRRDPYRPRPRGTGVPVAGDELGRLLGRAGLDGGSWGAVIPGGGGDLRPLACPSETAALHDRLVRGSASGRADVASHFATIAATHLAAVVPLGTLLAGEPLHLPEAERLSLTAHEDGWPVTLHVEEATALWSTSEAEAAGRFLADALTPVVDVLARLGGRARRSLWHVVATRLAYIGGEHAGVAGVLPGAVVERMLGEAIAAAVPLRRPPEFRTYRHARGTYRTVVFRGCCLGYRLAGGGCPFCPRYDAARQDAEVRGWLDSLPGEELLRGIPAAA